MTLGEKRQVKSGSLKTATTCIKDAALKGRRYNGHGTNKKGGSFWAAPVHHIMCWFDSWLCAGFLCCLAFVVDGGADLAEDFWGHVVHVVGGLGVFVGFLEDFVFGVAAQLDVASGDYIAAFQDFGHEESPCFGWEGNRRAAVGGCQREIGMTEVGEKQVPHTAKLRRDSG